MTVNSGNGILTIIVDGVNCKFWKLIDWFTKNNFKLKEFKFNQKKNKKQKTNVRHVPYFAYEKFVLNEEHLYDLKLYIWKRKATHIYL